MRQIKPYAVLIIGLSSLCNALPDAGAVTVTVGPVVPTNEPEWKDFPVFTSAVLNSTNTYRAQHNASTLRWNDTLADYSSSYLRKVDCDFKHSGGPYGENLAIGYENATDSVDAWGDERDKFDFGKPGFSEETGHFTQLVWKATRQVGCGRSLCGDKGWYLVCEYWPPGNVGGGYSTEVQSQVKSGDDGDGDKKSDGKGKQGGDEDTGNDEEGPGKHGGESKSDGELKDDKSDEGPRKNDYGILAMGFLVFGMVFYMVFGT